MKRDCLFFFRKTYGKQPDLTMILDVSTRNSQVSNTLYIQQKQNS